MSKSLDLIINEMVEQIRILLPEANVLPGSVLRESFVNAPAAQITQLYDAMESIRVAQSINEATGSDLDRLAANYSLTRKAGTPSFGLVTLVLSGLDSGRNILVSNGSIVSTNENTKSIDYTVAGTYTFTAANKDIYAADAYRLQNQLAIAGITQAKYVATVPIQAMSTGTESNVTAYSITRASINNISSVINLSPTVGGTDSESDEALRRRIIYALSGASTGTEQGLLSLVLANGGVSDAIVVRPGNPLMTRDGSEYDANGNLIKEGTGRMVDVYVKGASQLSTSEDFIFTDKDPNNTISVLNNLTLGYSDTSASNTFAKQPVLNISSLIGSVSGTNLLQAVEKIDTDGNVILEGNYILLHDYLADEYNVVKNNATGEVKLAKYLSPTSTKYTVINSLASSPNANSSLGLDAVLFLDKLATITNEPLVRGSTFSGTDRLSRSSVSGILNVIEKVVITNETVEITSQGSEQDAFIIYTKHVPVEEVTSVRNSRLGTLYSVKLLDASTGKIRLIGRFPPQTGDILQVSYTWNQYRLPNVEYHLQGDGVNWLFEDNQQSDSLTLLQATPLQSSMSLNLQPTTPTYLATNLSQVTDRTQYNMTIKGDTARVLSDRAIQLVREPSYTTNDYVFRISESPITGTDGVQLAKLLSVRNLTQGFSYNLNNASLQSNVYDASMIVEPALSSIEFALDKDANDMYVEVGDKVQFSRKSSMKNWTTQSDLANNIDGNLTPTYDSVTTYIDASGEVQVRRQEDQTVITQTTLAGTITQDGLLSGIVDIVDNVIIDSTVIIQPNTVIRIKPSADLNNTEKVLQKVWLDSTIAVADIATSTIIDYNAYLFQQPTGVIAPFFVILNTTGTESYTIYYNSSVVYKKVLTRDLFGIPLTYEYYINSNVIPNDFITGTGGLEAAMASVPATFIGHKVTDGSDIYFASKVATISGSLNYAIPVENVPHTTGIISDDFSFYQFNNVNAIFTDIFYDQGRNLILVDQLAFETIYTLEYLVNVVNRLSIRVRGTLQVSADVTEKTPVVFTSAATTPQPGDWDGIIFEASSRYGAPGNGFVQSFLNNCIIKYARVGVQNNISDPAITGCIIRKCSDAAYAVKSSYYALNGVTRSDLRLLSNDFLPAGRSYLETRQFVTASSRTLSFTLDNLLTAADGSMPAFVKVGTTEVVDTDVLRSVGFVSKYVASMTYGTDYKVYIDNALITPAVDADFMLEYDYARGGFLLSFFNTTLTQNYITSLGASPAVISIDYFAAYYNGLINDCILTGNGMSAVTVDDTAFLGINNNTIDNNGLHGIVTNNSYVTINNNLITGYKISSIKQDTHSVISARTNDEWSPAAVNAAATEIANIDRLLGSIDNNDTVLSIETPALYAQNMMVKIDNEYMLVQNVVGNRIQVLRAQRETVAVAHTRSTDILIERTKAVFTVAGVPGEFCQVREVDSNGDVLANRVPVDMNKIDDNMFRIAFTVDRSSAFYYRYQYKTLLADTNWIMSEVRKLPDYQFGSAVNDLVNANHEVNVPTVALEMTNYSADPEYADASNEYFAIANTSPCNADNQDYYATPYDVSVTRNRYLGRRVVTQTLNLVVGNASIVLDSVPVIVNGLQSDIIIKSTTSSRTLTANAYNPTTSTLTLTAPVSSVTAGVYEVTYYTPITLGSGLNSFPYTTTISYIYDDYRVVNFVSLAWAKTGASGNIKVRFRTAGTSADLTNQTFSDYYSVSPLDLSLNTSIYPRGRLVEIEFTLETNDAGFAADGSYLYPSLEDFTLYITPARDSVWYNVLNLKYDSQYKVTNMTIEDSEKSGSGIRNSTYINVGSDERLVVYVKKVDNTQFAAATCDAIATNDTVIRVFDDLVTRRSAPLTTDQIVADYIIVDVNNTERVVFIDNDTQITSSRFFKVTNIDTEVLVDKIISEPVGETVYINSTNQPAPNANYLSSYQFMAPTDNETITVSYIYNDLIRNVAASVEAERLLTSDVLVRAGFEIPIKVSVNIKVAAGFITETILIEVSNAIGNYLQQNSQFGSLLSSADLLTAILSVTGVSSATVNAFNRDGSNTLSSTIQLSDREYGVLSVDSPIVVVA